MYGLFAQLKGQEDGSVRSDYTSTEGDQTKTFHLRVTIQHHSPPWRDVASETDKAKLKWQKAVIKSFFFTRANVSEKCSRRLQKAGNLLPRAVCRLPGH